MYLNQYVDNEYEARYPSSISISKSSDSSSEKGDEDGEADDVVEISTKLVQRKSASKQRHSVSAEAFGFFNKKEVYVPVEIKKNEDQKKRIYEVISQCLLFNGLDEKAMDTIIGAMVENQFK